jgi:hypothetical protein
MHDSSIGVDGGVDGGGSTATSAGSSGGGGARVRWLDSSLGGSTANATGAGSNGSNSSSGARARVRWLLLLTLAALLLAHNVVDVDAYPAVNASDTNEHMTLALFAPMHTAAGERGEWMVRRAVDDINANPLLLPNVTLHIETVPANADPVKGAKFLVDLAATTPLAGLVGPYFGNVARPVALIGQVSEERRFTVLLLLSCFESQCSLFSHS